MTKSLKFFPTTTLTGSSLLYGISSDFMYLSNLPSKNLLKKVLNVSTVMLSSNLYLAFPPN